MTANAEIYRDAWNLLKRVEAGRTNERSKAARYYNAPQKSLEDFVAYWRTFVLTLEEIESVHGASIPEPTEP